MPMYALVQSGTITDLWRSDIPAPAAMLAAGWADTTGWTGPIVIGATVAGTVCTAPPPTVPAQVTMAQAKVVLFAAPKIGAGPTLLDDANAAVQAIGGVALIAWTTSDILSRDSTTMATVQARMGLTDAQVDALFIAADAIRF